MAEARVKRRTARNRIAISIAGEEAEGRSV